MQMPAFRYPAARVLAKGWGGREMAFPDGLWCTSDQSAVSLSTISPLSKYTDAHGLVVPGTRRDSYSTICFSAFRGTAFTTVRAGLAAIMISSPVKGFRPLRAFVAGLRDVRIFIRPGSVNCPAARFLTWRSIMEFSSSTTATTSFFATPVLSTKAESSWAFV